MAVDSRFIRAKKALKKGAEKARRARAQEGRGANRSTATRAAYKANNDAAVEALAILSESPRR